MKESEVRVSKMLGLRSDVRRERMVPGDLSEAVNVWLDQSGHVERRDGYTLASAGETAGVFSDGETLLCVRAGRLCLVNADYSLTNLAAASDTISYAALNGVIYWADGERTGVVESRRARSWGIQVPPLTPAEIIAGTLPPGAYQYAWTFVRNDGQESGASVAGTVDLPAGGGLRVNAPELADADVLQASLYVSTANGSTLYRAGTASLGAPVSLTDAAVLTAPLLTQYLSPPPVGSLVMAAGGRLWVAVGDTIYPSSPFAHELFDLNEYLPMDGVVTMLADSDAGLFVGTSKDTFYLSGKDPAAFNVTGRSTGPAVHGCLTYVPGELLGDGQYRGYSIPVWSCRGGIVAGYPDGTVIPMTERRNPLALGGRGSAYFDRLIRQMVFSTD